MTYVPGSGGGGNIATNGDVALNGVVDGEVLTYDQTLGKWKNAAVSGSNSLVVFSRGTTIQAPAVATIMIWRASMACQITKVLGYRQGGTGATINAQKNGIDKHLLTDLSLSTDGNWMEGINLQNTTFAAGDYLEIMITAVSGSVTQISVQVDFTLI